MMNKTQRGLGRGLDALFSGGNKEAEQPIAIYIPTGKIVPNKFQPRRVFEEEALTELTSSIAQYGVLQPIVVRKAGERFELVAGERRFSELLKSWRSRSFSNYQGLYGWRNDEIALIENIQRENLNAIEEAMAYRRLMDELSLTQEEVGQKLDGVAP